MRLPALLLLLLLVAGCHSDPYDQLGRAFHLSRTDSVQAARLFEAVRGTLDERAAAGDLRARHTLGTLLVSGSFERGMRGDSLRGITLLRAGAEAAHAPSIQFLGWLNFREKHYVTAAAYYERAAALGEPKAKLALGRLYAYGQGVEQNPERAVYWLSRAMAGDDGQARRRAAQHLRADVHNGVIALEVAEEALAQARTIRFSG